MNYLAHAYLSFNNEQLLVGNIIGDFVKGKRKDAFPEGITKGIELHRFIDSFTDAHPAIAQAKNIFKPAARLYSGAFTDISFDYFLANDEQIKTEQEWETFAQSIYQILEKYQSIFPQIFFPVFMNMKKYDWLYNYRFEKGIENSFNGLTRRIKYLNVNPDVAFGAFHDNISFLRGTYEIFFPELINTVREKINSILS